MAAVAKRIAEKRVDERTEEKRQARVGNARSCLMAGTIVYYGLGAVALLAAAFVAAPDVVGDTHHNISPSQACPTFLLSAILAFLNGFLFHTVAQMLRTAGTTSPDESFPRPSAKPE